MISLLMNRRTGGGAANARGCFLAAIQAASVRQAVPTTQREVATTAWRITCLPVLSSVAGGGAAGVRDYFLVATQEATVQPVARIIRWGAVTIACGTTHRLLTGKRTGGGVGNVKGSSLAGIRAANVRQEAHTTQQGAETTPCSIIELFRNKRQGKLSSKKAMEGANRWVYASETIVRCKPSPACPKPNLTICYPSAVTSTRQPSNKRMPKESHPARDGVNPAVAPKENCQRWRRNDQLSSSIPRPIPSWMGSQRSLRWRARKPRNTCSHQSGLSAG